MSRRALQIKPDAAQYCGSAACGAAFFCHVSPWPGAKWVSL